MIALSGLLSLCLLALAGAASLASRLWRDSRSERALAIAGLWLGIVLVPIHALGWIAVVADTPLLGRGSMALGIAALSLAALVAGIERSAPRASWLRIRSALVDLARLPFDALGECARARSLALFGVIAVLAIVLWTSWGSWLAPSSAWDGVFYHEAMIGFALQNGGFTLGDLPVGLAPIAGYPRMAENLSLFFVAFLDRRLIEFPGSPMLLVIALGAYVMIRRYVRARATAIGLATGLALLPGIALQLRSTYVDEIGCAFFVVALAFSTRPSLRPRDALLGALGIGLVGASKSTGFMIAPVMYAVLAGRVLAQVRGPGRSIATAAGALAIVGVLAVPAFARNWIEHENPIWPGHVHFESLGIDWPGPLDVASHDRSFDETISMLFSPPVAGQQYHDTRDNGYGNAPPFVILPLALLAIFLALGRFMRDAFLRRRGDAQHMLVMVLPMLATFAISPAKYWARLNLHAVVAIWVAAAWLVAKLGRAAGEGVVGAVVVGGIVTLAWSDPGWDTPLARVERLASLAPDERAISADGIITLMPSEIARERERMRDGDVVVFAEHPFPAQLWNERFTNRLVYLPAQVRWLERADELGAAWVVVPTTGGMIARVREQPETWEELGPAVRERDVTAFRRRAVAP